MSTLRWAFQHVKEEIPLVLHLRGTRIDPLSGEVGAECRHILRDVGVSRSQKIHLHCFTGGIKNTGGPGTIQTCTLDSPEWSKISTKNRLGSSET